MAGLLTPAGAADFGWFAYAPLSGPTHSPSGGADLWLIGLILSGLGTILGAVNMVTTVVCLRAPGMTTFRMPIFTWNFLATSVLILIAFPMLTVALFGQLADRHLGAHVFDPANGGAVLWQHLFWFFGHPEVYIVALPFFGIITEIIPVFSRKPLFDYKGMIFATVAITALSFAVWAHHMFATNEGMPRRYADYRPTDGFTVRNAISSVGAFLLGLSTLPFLWNVVYSYRYGRPASADDPWGYGNSLEWATSSPPPGTTSLSCPASAPNGRPSNCTTRTWWNRPARRHTHSRRPPPTNAPGIRWVAKFTRTVTGDRAEDAGDGRPARQVSCRRRVPGRP
jgi:heme/copper-type cytochrome/quinol oxidase subunit 1